MIALNILLAVATAVLILGVVVGKYKDKKKKHDFNTKNEIFNKQLEERLPNDGSDGRRAFFDIIRAANKHGVSTQTMISIMRETNENNAIKQQK